MTALAATGSQSLKKQAGRPEASLHRIADKLEQGQMQFPRERPHALMPKEVLATAVAGDGDDPLHDGHAIGHPEVERHLVQRTFAALFHRLAPGVVADLPVPVAVHRLLGRRRAPDRFVKHAVPTLRVPRLHVRPHPPDAVTLGKLRIVRPLRAAIDGSRRGPSLLEPGQDLVGPP